MRTTIGAFTVCAALLLLMGPAATGAWAQSTGISTSTTHMLTLGQLLNHECVSASALSVEITQQNGSVHNFHGGHFCKASKCPSVSDALNICTLPGATNLNCTILSFQSDCSTITLGCDDKSIHTLGRGTATLVPPNTTTAFVDGISLLVGFVNIVHGEMPDTDNNCGQRVPAVTGD